MYHEAPEYSFALVDLEDFLLLNLLPLVFLLILWRSVLFVFVGFGIKLYLVFLDSCFLIAVDFFCLLLSQFLILFFLVCFFCLAFDFLAHLSFKHFKFDLWMICFVVCLFLGLRLFFKPPKFDIFLCLFLRLLLDGLFRFSPPLLRSSHIELEGQ